MSWTDIFQSVAIILVGFIALINGTRCDICPSIGQIQFKFQELENQYKELYDKVFPYEYSVKGAGTCFRVVRYRKNWKKAKSDIVMTSAEAEALMNNPGRITNWTEFEDGSSWRY